MLGAILTLTLIPSLVNNVYAQIGMITLIGLSAKNAILIVEFAKERVDRGIPVVEATLAAVKLRLRPILMTSMAFILGVLPLALGNWCSQCGEVYHRVDGFGWNAGSNFPRNFYRTGIVCSNYKTFLWKGKISAN